MALPVLRRTWDSGEPWRELQDLQQEMNRIFSTFFGGQRLGRQLHAREEGAWSVPLEVKEAKDRLVVRAELPGIKPEDTTVSVQDNHLNIRAPDRIASSR
jgi:HSP20 family protein